jgi:hypothetical protein
VVAAVAIVAERHRPNTTRASCTLLDDGAPAVHSATRRSSFRSSLSAVDRVELAERTAELTLTRCVATT